LFDIQKTEDRKSRDTVPLKVFTDRMKPYRNTEFLKIHLRSHHFVKGPEQDAEELYSTVWYDKLLLNLYENSQNIEAQASK
jgi:hypothetical protein